MTKLGVMTKVITSLADHAAVAFLLATVSCKATIITSNMMFGYLLCCVLCR